MKRTFRLLTTSILVLLTAVTVIACSAPAGAPAADGGGSYSEEAAAEAPAEEAAPAAADDGDSDYQEGTAQEGGDTANLNDQATNGGEPLQTTALQNRKIIREATIKIEAADVTTVLNQATVLSVRVGGYTIGSNSWQEAGNRQYASFSFAVPVERFEEALEQARRLGKVTSENSTSQDVTAQYVDLEARVNNLEATAERVRGFLVEATDLKYILEVNRELSRIEGDLESLKGQRNVLAQRTSFSKIHLDITPPPVVPTTTEVLETAKVWSPAATFNSALAILLDVLKASADIAIWLVVIGLPVAIIIWVVWAVLRQLRRTIFGRTRSVMTPESEAAA